MATYDPEAVRSRPAAPKVSPLDDLLDGQIVNKRQRFKID